MNHFESSTDCLRKLASATSLDAPKERVTSGSKYIRLYWPLAAERKKLENGKSTSFIVLQLISNLTTAKVNEVQALANYNNAVAQLALDEGDRLALSGVCAVGAVGGAELLGRVAADLGREGRPAEAGRQHGEAGLEAIARKDLAHAYQAEHRDDEALESLRESLRLFESRQDVQGQAEVLDDLGTGCAVSDFELAQRYFLSGLRLSAAADLTELRDKLKAQLMEPIPGTPAEFRARIDADIARWRPVIVKALPLGVSVPAEWVPSPQRIVTPRVAPTGSAGKLE